MATWRRSGAAVTAAAAVVAVMVQTHGTCSGSVWNLGFTGFLSLFSWPHWVLVLVLLGAGGTIARANRPATAAVAGAAALAPAAQMAGSGIVAYKHWHPAAGISGCGAWTNMRLIETVALGAAIAAALAAVTCIRLLRTTGWLVRDQAAATTYRVRAASVAVGVLIAVALPLLMALGDPSAQDITSLGAYALIWSLPWGGVLALTAWLHRPAAVAAALGVAVTSVTAYPSYELVRVEQHWVPVLTGLASGLLLAGVRSARARDARSIVGTRD